MLARQFLKKIGIFFTKMVAILFCKMSDMIYLGNNIIFSFSDLENMGIDTKIKTLSQLIAEI